MEEKTPDKIAAFDTIFTTNQIQMYKILFCYLPSSFQKTLAMYIKFSELMYTMNLFEKPHPFNSFQNTFSSQNDDTQNAAFPLNIDITGLCEEILPYMPSSEQPKIQQIKEMMQNLKNFQEMFEMVDLMKDMFPEGMGNDGFDFSNLSGMMDMAHAMSNMSATDIS